MTQHLHISHLEEEEEKSLDLKEGGSYEEEEEDFSLLLSFGTRVPNQTVSEHM